MLHDDNELQIGYLHQDKKK